jgi:acetyl esterase
MGAHESSSPLSATTSEPKLDPDVRRFVTDVQAAWSRHGDLSAVSRAAARRIAEEVRAPWKQGGPRMESTQERMIPANPPVRVRFYDPDRSGRKPAFIYLHGGGWTTFSIDTHDRVMREYAARAGVVVAGVDYALAPEAKYPIALEQTVAVARYLAMNGGEVGVDPTRIAIGGDSAGGNLAIAASLRLRDLGDTSLIRAMVLNYGVFARESSPEAIRKFGGEGNILTIDEMEGLWQTYLSDPAQAQDPLVCPLGADLKGLPPAFLVVPECDLLTEQSIALADRLRAAGVPVTTNIYRGAAHSFLEAISIAPLAARAFDDTALWLRATLSTR